ncbi:conserved hypothetical protein [Treponema primitia ZAS-2]|uniref:Uncharacterized protein n=1 Tax=Treponema primitia (strain ATCC BAA-887 / DSM 12427 / ZAS-2) TaxID=545694 RepID=F5YL63_TREPZ|nr:hypothetical protein [Treponema primitia]AEF83773.1 conserved hypothetical protein [Treponema primitia ZAS-2]
MATQELKDANGRLIGTIRNGSNGGLEIFDESGWLKGTYDPQSDQTKDSSERLVGTGNLLTTLL